MSPSSFSSDPQEHRPTTAWANALLIHLIDDSPVHGKPALQGQAAAQILLETILNQLSYGLLVFDSRGKLIFLNDAAAGYLLAPHSEQASLDTFASLLNRSPHGNTLLWLLSRALKGETATDWEERLFQRNGTFVDVQVTTAPLRSEQQDIIGAVMTWVDITARKQSDQEHLVTQAILDSSDEPIIGRTLDGTILTWNAGAERLYGYTAAETIGQNVSLFLAPGGEDEHLRPLEALQRGAKSVAVEETWLHKDGSILNVTLTAAPIRNQQGHMIGISTIARDIIQPQQMAEALRQSEERFRDLADAMPQLVWTARPDGTVDYYNKRYSEFQGIAPDDDGTWHWAPVLHPDDREVTVEAWTRAVQTGEVYEINHRILQADGTFCWYLSRGVPVKDAQGQVIKWYGTATDIHEQKQAEEALRASAQQQYELVQSIEAERNRLAAVLANLPVGVWITDSTGRIVETNPHTSKIWGGQAPLSATIEDYAVYRSWWPETGQAVRPEEQPLARVLLTKQPAAHDEFLIQRFDGTFGVILSSASPIYDALGNRIGAVGIAQDTTTRRQMEEKLRESEERFRLSVENLLEAFTIYSAIRNYDNQIVDFRVDYANEAACRFSGRTHDNYVGRTMLELYPDLHQTPILKWCRQTVESGEPIIRDNYPFNPAPTSRQEMRYFDFRIIALGDGVTLTWRDVTERIQAEQQARSLTAERERIQILTEFVQNVSHDFKTPLSTIKTSLYLLTRISDPEQQQRHINMIEQQTQRLTMLLDGMLRMTRLDRESAVTLRRVDLNRLVHKVYDLRQTAARQKGLETQLRLSDETLDVLADAAELEQALLNLMNNAVQFTPPGRSVTIYTHQQDSRAVVEFRDSGIGIDQANLPHIFERLYRADKARSTHSGGVGLGLSIAQKILHLHGGDIEVSSVLGEGTTFRVWLPVFTG